MEAILIIKQLMSQLKLKDVLLLMRNESGGNKTPSKTFYQLQNIACQSL